MRLATKMGLDISNRYAATLHEFDHAIERG